MANVGSNLILFKARQQYGLRLFSESALIIFSLVLLLHIFVQTYEMAVLVRFVSGFVSAPLTSLGIYYITQAFKRVYFVRGLYLAFGFQQLGIPLAWMISPALVDVQDWKIFYTFELGLVLCCLAMVVSLKLPRSAKFEVFEYRDLITFSLLASGFGLLCILFTQGPILWWFEAKWLAYIAILALMLLVIGFTYEHFRASPLIFTRWLGTSTVLRFIFGAFALRFIMSEQSYAAVNFLKTMGMGPDQVVTYYSLIFLGIFLGTIFSALTFSTERAPLQLTLAVILILVACSLDYNLTNEIRPENFFVSQFLVGFAGGLFIGPLILIGFIKVMQQGSAHMVTFVVMLSASQTFGGLMGSSFFSTYQQIRTQEYRAEIINQLQITNPLVEQRLQLYQQKAQVYTNDPALMMNQAERTLHQTITKEARVRAFNDVIFLNGLFGVLLLLWRLSLAVLEKYKAYKQKKIFT